MKLKFCLALMLVAICSIGLLTASAKTVETTKVTIHYKQLEGDTTVWSLWVWGKSDSGVRYPFTGTDEYGQVAVIELPGKFSKVGVIVSTEDWKKDGGDRFVDIVDGAGELYVTGGDYIDNSAGKDIPYLWALIGLIMIPVLFNVFEYIRSKHKQKELTV